MKEEGKMRITVYLKSGKSIEGIPLEGFNEKCEELDLKNIKLLDALVCEFEEQEYYPTYAMVIIPVSEVLFWAICEEEEKEEKKSPTVREKPS